MTRRLEEDEEGGKDVETRWRRRMETRRGETTKGGGREMTKGGREMTKGGEKRQRGPFEQSCMA